MGHAIIGPVLSDIMALAGGEQFVLASAFYSAARLDATTISAKRTEILVRLDLASIDEWVARTIAPDALLRLLQRHPDIDIKVYCSPTAHAKVYAGDTAFFVGSANYTVRGLSGMADEILWLESDPKAAGVMRRALALYRSTLQPIAKDDLEEYVNKNLAKVKDLHRKARRSREDVLPSTTRRPPRIGTYEKFLTWLRTARSPAAAEVLARARGKGNLSGHIRMNFYGIRQFLLGHPVHGRRLRDADPALYRLTHDNSTEEALGRFVRDEAADEGGLVVDTWRTYLPESVSGKPKSGGGTLGNLNRMLPLMARHLKQVCR